MKIISKGTTAMRSSKMSYIEKKWAKGSFVLDKIKSQTVQGLYITELESSISYADFNKIMFPKKLLIKTSQRLNKNLGQSAKKTEVSSQASLLFKNYKVNEGVARKFFVKR